MSFVEEEELSFEPIKTRESFPYHPRSIRYTQDSINPCFKSGKSLVLTLHFLRTGELLPVDIPNIKVFVRDNKVYSLDNRRLWLFKQFNREIHVDVVKYDTRFDAKITTTTDGERVYIRRFKEHGIEVEEEDSRDASTAFKKKILLWTNEQIMKEVGKLPLLPEIFESAAHYLTYFQPHVVEEVRAELKRSIETMYEEAPRVEFQIRHCFRPPGGELFEVHAAVVRRMPEDLNLGKANDVLLISERPEGAITNRAITIHHDSILPIVKFNVLNFDNRPGDTLFAHYCGNITTSIRINNALRSPRGLKMFMDQLVLPYQHHFLDDTTQTAIPLKLNQFIKDRFNASQQLAIRSITAATSKDFGKGVMLLQGPPGTGKTATIIGALSVLVARRVRVLVCSSSNHAVDDIARKVANRGLVGEDGETVYPFVILLGNEDNIDLSGGLEKIFIDNIIKNMHRVKGKLIAIIDKIGAFFTAPGDPTTFLSSYEQYKKVESRESQKNQKTKKEDPAIIEFITKAISGWVAEFQLWLSDSQAGLLPAIHQRYKLTIQDGVVPTLRKMLPVLASLSSDIIGPGNLVGFLQNGLPAAVSNNAPAGIKTFCALWQGMVHEIRSISKHNEEMFTDIEDMVLQAAEVVFCTVSTCGSFLMRKTRFEIGIVDEAAQCIEAETLLALNLISNRCVLVGDPQQLPSTVISQEAARLHYGRSMMARMMDCRHPSLLLDVQYRMHPDISAFPNATFYQGKIRDGEPVKQKEHGGKWHGHPLFPTYAFFDIKGTEERDLYTRSLFNTHEVHAIGHIISNLLRAYPDISHDDIGLITPYRQQVRKLTEQFAKLFPGNRIEVNTVDGFQGREKNIIIFSAVRANWNNELGFVKDYHRLNVALTRARYSIWIVGHYETLANDMLWRRLIQDAKKRGRLFTKEQHNISVDPKIAVELAMNVVEKPNTNTRRPIFEDAPWQVILSNRACEAIRVIMHTKEQEVTKRLFERLLWLAMGNRPSNFLSCQSSEFVRDLLFEYKLKSGQTILWTVDIDRYQCKQIFKVWDVVPTPDKLIDSVRRIERTLHSFSQPYVDLCKLQLHDEGLMLPLTFKPEDLAGIIMLEQNKKMNQSGEVIIVVHTERVAVEDSFLLMKFFPLSSHLARMLAVGNDIEIPFQLSPEETELVKYPMASLFILGRSGTGKTTVLVFRMFAIQQAYQNSVLADQMASIECGEKEETTKKESDQKKHAAGKRTVVRQLFVTASPHLSKSIKKYYNKLHSAIKPDNTLNKNASMDDEMNDEDEDINYLADVPNSLSLVTEADCTLILTFIELLSMIDRSFPEPFFNERDPNSLWSIAVGSTRIGGTVRKEVDFPRFSELYYKHFDQRMTAHVDAATVFLQIMSFIKGSAEAVLTPKGHLSESAYLSFPAKKCPLAHGKREIVYRLYERYEVMKAEKNDYDLCDYVFHVIKQLRNNEVLPIVVLPKIDFVYIDEVQDLTQGQMLIFRYICNNLKGFVFAGDTAQTITRGVGFRFEDIRSLYYTEFAKGRETVPDLHQLSQNFRTHSGICNMASSVVEPILRFFPESIDKLKRETALVAGDCPIFLEIQGFKEIFFHMFRKDTKVRVEFGAEQAIIVRDEATKAKLLSEIDSGLVLTIYEAKGLEFKSVLLFNFWNDSPAKNTWNVLYQYMAEKAIGTPGHYQEFSPEKFSALCNELKQLYVAITRTRQDLFIFDEDVKTHQSMLDYWTALGYINRVSTMDHPAIANLAQKSEPEKWQSEGKKYFQLRNYDLALRCFINAGSEYYQLWTKACILKVEGKRFQNMDKTDEAMRKFRDSADLYLQAHVHPEKDTDKKLNVFAANIYIKCNEFTKAGEIFLAEGEFSKAGECFRVVKRFDKAVHCFEKANMFPMVLDCCKVGSLYELGREAIIRFQNRKAIPPNFDEKVYEFLRTGALHFNSAQNKGKTLLFVHMFEPISHRRKFLTRYGYVDELVKVELAEGNYSKAGDIYLANGKYEEASNSYVTGKDLAKAADSLIKQAKSLEVVQLAEAIRSTKPLNANAPAWVPKSRNNNNNNNKTNSNNNNSSQHQNNKNIAQMKPILDLLVRAKLLVETETTSRTLFEVDLMLAMKHNDTAKLESLLLRARDQDDTANELDILFQLLPAHIANGTTPISQLLEEGTRAKKLGLEMLDVLSAAEFNRPFQASKIQRIEDLLHVRQHPNPEMKVVQRIDWLDKADYKLSVAVSGQLEVRRDVFLQRATTFLGRQVVSNMIGIADQFAQRSDFATSPEAKTKSIFEAISWGKEILDILKMTHLHFNVTLQDLRRGFELKLESCLRDFARIYYPPERTVKAPTYLHYKRTLKASPSASQSLLDLCYEILFSLHVRFSDGLCISLLAELGHNLILNINNYQLQHPLIEFLLSRETGQFFTCSPAGVKYLRSIVHNNELLAPGLPPSQAVWILENLVVYNLAYCTNFHHLILPKSLALDCMAGREPLLAKCLFPRKRKGGYYNQRDYLDMNDIWYIIVAMLEGKLYGWFDVFKHEKDISSLLVERLLQLLFLIRINTYRDFSLDLADFLKKFLGSYRLNFEMILSPQWLDAISSQIKFHYCTQSCADFLEMARVAGEPYVRLKRWNTFEDRPHWSNIPTAVVFPPDQVLNFTVIENITLIEKKSQVQLDAPTAEEEARKETEENMPQQEVDEREEDTKEEEKKEENPMIKEAKYFNNMKGSLKYKMLRWLRRVRRRMYTCTLSVLEKYQLEARNVLNQKPEVNEEYVDFYCEHVCSLREQLVAAYESLNTSIANLKALNLTGSQVEILLDKGLDAVDDTQDALEVLDIKHPQHSTFSMEWLQSRVKGGTTVIQRIHKLENSMQHLETLS